MSLLSPSCSEPFTKSRETSSRCKLEMEIEFSEGLFFLVSRKTRCKLLNKHFHIWVNIAHINYEILPRISVTKFVAHYILPTDWLNDPCTFTMFTNVPLKCSEAQSQDGNWSAMTEPYHVQLLTSSGNS